MPVYGLGPHPGSDANRCRAEGPQILSKLNQRTGVRTYGCSAQEMTEARAQQTLQEEALARQAMQEKAEREAAFWKEKVALAKQAKEARAERRSQLRRRVTVRQATVPKKGPLLKTACALKSIGLTHRVWRG